MERTTAEVVICGAGIAGASAAYHLVVERGIRDVVIVDEHPPLSLTSDKSMECYRNWYPGPGDDMVALMNRSIDLMEALERETSGRFNLNRRGYAFATADPATAERLQLDGEEKAALGAGELRVHRAGGTYCPAPASGFEEAPTGADLLLDRALIRAHFPHLAPETMAVLHTRRCGWLSAQQYGAYLLERAREGGLRWVQGRLAGIERSGGAVSGVRVDRAGPGPLGIATPCFVSAAGPLQGAIGAMLGVELPITCELHRKAAFRDPEGIVPRGAPMLVWMDPVNLRWTDEEREALAGDAAGEHLLRQYPSGVHGRPEGAGDVLLLQWTLHEEPVEPLFPVPEDPELPEILLRGMAVAIPGLETYFGRGPRPFVDGGYYAKTPENRPLACPLPVPGAYLLGGLSGFGMQSASALGELLSLHVAGDPLPSYAGAFALARYQDPGYLAALESVGSGSGQI